MIESNNRSMQIGLILSRSWLDRYDVEQGGEKSGDWLLDRCSIQPPVVDRSVVGIESVACEGTWPYSERRRNIVLPPAWSQFQTYASLQSDGYTSVSYCSQTALLLQIRQGFVRPCIFWLSRQRCPRKFRALSRFVE